MSERGRSGMSGIGKLKAFKLLESNEIERKYIALFGEDGVNLNELEKIGEDFIMHLYKSSTKLIFKTLDELQYQYFKSPKYVPIERMPPTSRAGTFHSLQVHLQVHTWKHLKMMLPVDEFGFKIDGGNVIPIVTDLPVASDNILKDIRCNCCKKKPVQFL